MRTLTTPRGRALPPPEPAELEELVRQDLAWHAEWLRSRRGELRYGRADLAGLLAHVAKCLESGAGPGRRRDADATARRLLYEHLDLTARLVGLRREAVARLVWELAESYQADDADEPLLAAGGDS